MHTYNNPTIIGKKIKKIDVVILAGGRGKRLRPITNIIPKPLVDINGAPLLEIILKKLSKTNLINNVFILTGYKSSKIENYIKNRLKNFNFKKIYISKSPLHFETFKRLQVIRNLLGKKFMILYGDTYINFNLKKYLQKNDCSSSILIKDSKDCREIGNIDLSTKPIYKKKRDVNFKYLDLGFFITNHKIFSIKTTINPSLSDILEIFIPKEKIIFNITRAKYLNVTDPKSLNEFRREYKKFKY